MFKNGSLKIGLRKLFLRAYRWSCDNDTRLCFPSDDGKSYMVARSKSEAQQLANDVLAHIAQASRYVDPEQEAA